MAKLEALQKNIETLRAAIPELRGVLIASTEGLPVAHSIAGGADPARVAAMADRIAAMAAAAVNLGKRVSESLSVGALVEISVTGADGQIFIYSAATKGVLAVIAPKGGNAGLVHLEARAVANDVADQFKAAPDHPVPDCLPPCLSSAPRPSPRTPPPAPTTPHHL